MQKVVYIGLIIPNYCINIMKKTYLVPATRFARVQYEANFMTSPVGLGGSTGEDLDNPDDINPWS